MEIQYETNGHIRLECKNNVVGPVALNWVKGSRNVKLQAGNTTIHMSRSQLKQLINSGPAIVDDLEDVGDVVEVALGTLQQKRKQ